MTPMHDLVIRGGTVVDGTGAPSRKADVAIDGDRIVAVGSDIAEGKREIDATGQLVTPGWATATATPFSKRFRARSNPSCRRSAWS